MEKMETKVSEREAKAAALHEMANDNLDSKFKSFEGQADVEAELNALKGQFGKPVESKIDTPTKIVIEEKEPVLLEDKQQKEEVLDAEEIRKENG